MNLRRPRSLKWSLVLRIAILQCVMLTLIIAGIIGAMLATGIIPHDYEDGTMDVLADAVVRDANGDVLTSVDLAAVGSTLDIRVADGHVHTVVERVESDPALAGTTTDPGGTDDD